jgi:4-diphosphocytidyl-2-C-methyl-D-erythritol kinase
LLFPLVDRPSSWVTVVIPSFGVSTKEAFGWFDQDRRGQAAKSASSLRRSRQDPAGQGLYGGGNDLQIPVARRHPEIGRIVSALRRSGASHSAMSGSGSAVFGLFDRRTAAVRAASALGTSARRTLVTHTLARAEYQRLAAN